jgi:hypothetical protein
LPRLAERTRRGSPVDSGSTPGRALHPSLILIDKKDWPRSVPGIRDPRIQRVAHGVAEQVDREDRDHDREAGEDGEPPRDAQST